MCWKDTKVRNKLPCSSTHTYTHTRARAYACTHTYTRVSGSLKVCPLSPLLFDLSIEPLAIALRQNNEIIGITRGGQVTTDLLYVDDLLLFLFDPEVSIPTCMDTILQFGMTSGYKISLTKSVLFPVSLNAHQLGVTTGPLTYMGAVLCLNAFN